MQPPSRKGSVWIRPWIIILIFETLKKSCLRDSNISFVTLSGSGCWTCSFQSIHDVFTTFYQNIIYVIFKLDTHNSFAYIYMICCAVDEVAPLLTRGLGFEPQEKILGRECFSPNGALHGMNPNIVGLQCGYRIPGGKPKK